MQATSFNGVILKYDTIETNILSGTSRSIRLPEQHFRKVFNVSRNYYNLEVKAFTSSEFFSVERGFNLRNTTIPVAIFYFIVAVDRDDISNWVDLFYVFSISPIYTALSSMLIYT